MVSVDGPIFYPEHYPGADLGAKIHNAVQELPSSGGTIDARRFTGNQAISATVIVDRPVVLLLGHAQITISATPGILTTGAGRLSIEGVPIEGTGLYTSRAQGDMIQHTANSMFQCRNLYFAPTVTQTGGAAISIVPTTYANRHLVQECDFESMYRCIVIGNANTILIDRCGFANTLHAGILSSYIPAASDSGQTAITNCIFNTNDAASTAAGVYWLDSSGLYMVNNTILAHAYGVLVECTQDVGAFNEFMFYNNRISHQRAYGIVCQRSARTAVLQGIQVFGNSFGLTDAHAAAGVSLQTISAGFAQNVIIQGNYFSMTLATHQGCEIAGGTHITIGGNMFTTSNAAAQAINVGSLPVGLRVLPNSYYGFTTQLTNASATTVVYPAAVSPPTDGQVAMVVQRNVGGVITTQQVSMGGADSGGAGFRLLRVPN
jgi:hypothetical protein